MNNDFQQILSKYKIHIRSLFGIFLKYYFFDIT
jgi:hypothetical protein